MSEDPMDLETHLRVRPLIRTDGFDAQQLQPEHLDYMLPEGHPRTFETQRGPVLAYALEDPVVITVTDGDKARKTLPCTFKLESNFGLKRTLIRAQLTVDEQAYYVDLDNPVTLELPWQGSREIRARVLEGPDAVRMASVILLTVELPFGWIERVAWTTRKDQIEDFDELMKELEDKKRKRSREGEDPLGPNKRSGELMNLNDLATQTKYMDLMRSKGWNQAYAQASLKEIQTKYANRSVLGFNIPVYDPRVLGFRLQPVAGWLSLVPIYRQ